jgi:hypothetical protein
MILAIHSPPSRAALASPELGPLFRRLLSSLSSQTAEAWRSATPADSGAATISLMPITRSRSRNAGPYDAWYLGKGFNHLAR